MLDWSSSPHAMLPNGKQYKEQAFINHHSYSTAAAILYKSYFNSKSINYQILPPFQNRWPNFILKLIQSWVIYLGTEGVLNFPLSLKLVLEFLVKLHSTNSLSTYLLCLVLYGKLCQQQFHKFHNCDLVNLHIKFLSLLTYFLPHHHIVLHGKLYQ